MLLRRSWSPRLEKLDRSREEVKLRLHICTVLSNPERVTTIEFRPTINDIPLLDQPPLLVNSVKTAFALFLGARTMRGIIIENKPTIWSINITPSTKGNFFARNVLKMTVKQTTPITIIVPCQARA